MVQPIRWSIVAAATALVLAFSSTLLKAGTATANLTVQVTITASCTISAATLNFGSVAGTTVATTAQTGSATVSVTCTNGSAYSVGMGQGNNYSGGSNRMNNSTNYIPYGLYTDVGLTHAWTTTTSSSSCTGGASTCYLGTGTGSSQNITVYGQIPSTTTAPATGTYSDTVTMTITY